MNSRGKYSILVYSTDTGRLCPICHRILTQCTCRSVKRIFGDGVVRVSREKKGRAGKGVTLVKGLNLDDEAMSALGKKLKAACGSGGTVKNGVVEVQGDHCDRLMSLLHEQGFIVKRAGG